VRGTILASIMNKLGRPKSPILALEALAMLWQSTKVMSDTIKGLVGSSNRHGDLQVIRSSAVRAIEAADTLIAEEQGQIGALAFERRKDSKPKS
jgi:hypothetical protein